MRAARQFVLSKLDEIEAYKKNEMSVTDITANVVDNIARFSIIIKTPVPFSVRNYVENDILSKIEEKDMEEIAPYFDTPSEVIITQHFVTCPDGVTFCRYQIKGNNVLFMHAARQFAVSKLEEAAICEKNEVAVTEMDMNIIDDIACFNIVVNISAPDYVRTYIKTNILSKIKEKDLEELLPC